MNVATNGLDQVEDETLTYQLSDETLERAGTDVGRAAMTVAMCSGLSSCPSAPA